MGRHEGAIYTLCTRHREEELGTFFVRSGEEVRTLAVQPPTKEAKRYRVGHWAWAKLSPDGRTILAQWSGACEVPTAFFVSPQGGKPWPVTTERRYGAPPESVALGWTRGGQAVIAFPKGPCGAAARRPGVYHASVRGALRYVRPWRGLPDKRPRTIDEPAAS